MVGNLGAYEGQSNQPIRTAGYDLAADIRVYSEQAQMNFSSKGHRTLAVGI
jgi:hypothetical protein